MAERDGARSDLLVIFGIYAPGSWGPAAAESLLRGHRGWRQPWLPARQHA